MPATSRLDLDHEDLASARKHFRHGLLGVAVVFAACGKEPTTSGESGSGRTPSLPVLTDVSRLLGGQFRHDKAGSHHKHLPETMAGGGGFVDYDGDGDLDIYLVQSANYPGGESSGLGNVILRREADGTYVDVTAETGGADALYGFGVQAADIDNDGDQDLFVTNFGRNVLLRNDGGRFVDVTSDYGVGDERWSTSAAFLDLDQDGWLDLYVCNYIHYNDDVARECSSSDGKVRSYCSPTQFDGIDDVLYRSEAGRRFIDISEAAGILGPRGKGLGVCAADLDDDHLVDLIVANDTTPTLFFKNAGDGTFVEDGLVAGIARSEDGVARAGMGIDVGDADGDGRMDVVVTNFGAEVNALYVGRDGWFEEVSHESGFGPPSFPFLGFGVCLTDLDWDGDLDAVVINGHVLDTVDRTSKGMTYRQRPMLFLNDEGRFREVGVELAPFFQRGLAGRGLATGDIDGDGDEDFLFLQVDDRPLLLRNDTPRAGHGIVLKLVGTTSNRDAIGARVDVVAGDRTLRRAVVSGRSYLSMHDRRLSIGVGDAERIDRVVIRWPSGAEESVEDLAVDHRYVVEEGKGVVDRAALPPANGGP